MWECLLRFLQHSQKFCEGNDTVIKWPGILSTFSTCLKWLFLDIWTSSVTAEWLVHRLINKDEKRSLWMLHLQRPMFYTKEMIFPTPQTFIHSSQLTKPRESTPRLPGLLQCIPLKISWEQGCSSPTGKCGSQRERLSCIGQARTQRAHSLQEGQMAIGLETKCANTSQATHSPGQRHKGNMNARDVKCAPVLLSQIEPGTMATRISEVTSISSTGLST